MGFFLPLTGGLLAGATLFHLFSSRIEHDTKYAKLAFRRMQQTLEENLPPDAQDKNLFVPSSPLKQAVPAYRGSSRDAVITIFNKQLTIPNYNGKVLEAKDNWNRQIRSLASVLTGSF
ncbi:hypothetical protein DFS34DRAFT_692630 [Phlyctochytrium arcticum]|nr:hypothetical protein DFS34DRAFT_692630 [Phlyctochytrium arcticum]